MTKPVLRLLAILWMSSVLSGCAGMRLYSETRDKQGQVSAKAWSEVDLPGYFKAHRDERKKLLQAELDSAQLHLMAKRENELRLITNGTLADFQKKIDDEVNALVGSARSKLGDWSDQNEELIESRREQEDARTRLAGAKQLQFTCPAAVTANVPASAQPALKSLVDACDREAVAVKALTALNAAMGSAAAEDWKAIGDQERTIETAKTEAQKRAAAYKDAKKAYETAVAADAKAGATKPSEQASRAAANLRSAIQALQALNDAFGKKAQADARVDTINELLEKVEEGAEPGKDASHKEVVALMLPRIADDLKALSDLRSTTPKVALLIRRDIENGRAAVAQMELDVEEQRLALGQKILASRVEEALLIHLAGDALKPAMAVPALHGTVYYNAVKRTGNDAVAVKRGLYDSAGRFLDAVGRQRVHTRKLELMQIAITHERAMAYAELNAGQWSALIGSVVGQAAEFAAGGQKFSDYKDLVQTLTLLWIGKGVNE